jgi:hypothetical protein
MAHSLLACCTSKRQQQQVPTVSLQLRAKHVYWCRVCTEDTEDTDVPLYMLHGIHRKTHDYQDLHQV